MQADKKRSRKNFITFIVIDDIQCPIIGNLIKKKYPDANIEKSCNLEEIRQKISDSNPDSIIILLNAHAKFKQNDFRYTMQGIWFLKEKLRAEWQMPYPVIIYSPLDYKKLLNFISLFKKQQGHYFICVTELSEKLYKIIHKIKPAKQNFMQKIAFQYELRLGFCHSYWNSLLRNLKSCNKDIALRRLREARNYIESLERKYPQQTKEHVPLIRRIKKLLEEIELSMCLNPSLPEIQKKEKIKYFEETLRNIMLKAES